MEAIEAVRKLHEWGIPRPVIKLDAEGVVWFDPQSGPHHRPVIRANVVDTVAAGDAFNGALATALNDGLSFSDAIDWGRVAGAICVEREGAQSAMPTRQQLLTRLRPGTTG
jgi:ribokinase